MQGFRRHTGRVVPLGRDDVDTDQIMPKQFLKRVERTGYKPYLFHDWRYLADGAPDPDFALNRPEHQGATVLVAGRNFGCGSSREHAAWGLADYGFRAIVAPSFADIFYANCFNNGILPVVLPDEQVAELLANAGAIPGYTLTVDLPTQTVADGRGFEAAFEIDAHRRERFIGGLDDIVLTLRSAAAIAAYEARRPAHR